MAVTYKDIDSLSKKASVAGTEKIPVSDTEYITPEQVISKCGKAYPMSAYDCNEISPSFAVHRLASGTTHGFPNCPWGNILTVGYPGTDTEFQLGGDYNGNLLYFRTGTWSSTGGSIRNKSWKRLAFYDEIPTKSSDLTNDSGYKKITVSSSEPTSSDGEDGDIWIVI